MIGYESLWFPDDNHWLLITLHVGLGTVAGWHALLTKRDPRGAMGWIAVCLLSPLIGALLYYFFGINRVARKARTLRPQGSPRTLPATSDASTVGQFSQNVSAECLRLIHISDALSPRPLLGGNRFELLSNGDEAYPAMLSAIEGATRSIYLETYIFSTDATGQRFIDALHRATSRGVDVRILIDGAGDCYAYPKASRLLRGKGINAVCFLPPRLLPPSRLINLRNHRKLLVIDGKEAYVGGMNISGRHMLGDRSRGNGIVDSHFRVNGPIVGQIGDAFVEDWEFTTGELLSPAGDAAPPSFEGDSFARVITGGPEEEMNGLSTIIASAISSAEKRISIMTPYFLPTLELATAIESAALRGVTVSILLPARNNLPYVHWASHHILGELINRGVSVCFQPTPFVHSKLLLIDDHYVLIGSANLDSRSLRLNFEIAVEIFDGDFAGIMAQHFAAARRQSRALTLDEIKERSLFTKTRDALCWLMSPYL